MEATTNVWHPCLKPDTFSCYLHRHSVRICHYSSTCTLREWRSEIRRTEKILRQLVPDLIRIKHCILTLWVVISLIRPWRIKRSVAFFRANGPPTTGSRSKQWFICKETKSQASRKGSLPIAQNSTYKQRSLQAGYAELSQNRCDIQDHSQRYEEVLH